MGLSPRQCDLLATIWSLQNKNQEPTVALLAKLLNTNSENIARIVCGLPDREKIITKERNGRKTIYFLNRANIVTSVTVGKVLLKLKRMTICDYILRNNFEDILLQTDFIINRPNPKGEPAKVYVKRVLDWSLKPEINYICTQEDEPDFIGCSQRLIDERNYLQKITGEKATDEDWESDSRKGINEKMKNFDNEEIK